MAAAMSRATFSMKLKSTEPSGCGGVGTAMKITSDFWTPSAVLVVNSSRPAATFFFTRFFQAGFVNRNAAGLKQLDLRRVVIHANDLMADLGETGAGDQTDVARADNRQFHVLLPRLGRDHRGCRRGRRGRNDRSGRGRGHFVP